MDTQIARNAQAWHKTLEEPDEKTNELRKIWNENFVHLCSKKMECSEIAAIVQEIILGQNTKFRCYTHPEFMADALAAKLKDSATNEPIKIITKLVLEKQENKN